MIKWIDGNLGTAPFNSIPVEYTDFVIDVRDLVDKEGNSIESVKEKILKGVSYLNKGGKAIICCDYGMSRSNAIAAGILAAWSNISFYDAVKRVISATCEKAIRIEVLAVVRRALDEIASKPGRVISSDKKRILITGGSGFIGKAVFAKLEKTYDVFAPSRDEIDLLKGSAELDLFVKEFAITHILHLANSRIYATNKAMGESLTLLKNVIDVCTENNTNLYYLSGWEVYSGYSSQIVNAAETTPLLPKSTFGESKYLCELLIEHLKKAGRLNCTVIRSGTVYGAGSDKPKFIYDYIRKALANEDIITHKFINGYPYLDLLYVDDLSDFIVKALNENSTGCFNVGSGKSISTKEIAEIIVEFMKSDSAIKHNYIEAYTTNVIMDYSHANKMYNWQPKIDIYTGLKKVIQRFSK